MSSKAACARSGGRVRITVQLNDVATGSHLWAERYDRDLADVFAVQDEITEAIVATIEPQLYAAENFRARRKAPESLDAWDLVMRALAHFWRVTREDNVVTQALLEKAIAIDPNYAQALAVLAVSHTFGGRMGWEDAATVRPAAERAALAAVQADGEDPWAHLALACARGYRDRLEELARRVRTGSAPQSELRAGARLLWPGAVLGRALARRCRSRPPRAAAKSARSVRGDLQRRGRLRRIRRTRLQRGDPAGARWASVSATTSPAPTA